MTIKKWTIYRANFDPAIGSEQGKQDLLIISENEINEIMNTVNVLPITSRKAGRQVYPNEVIINANNFGLE